MCHVILTMKYLVNLQEIVHILRQPGLMPGRLKIRMELSRVLRSLTGPAVDRVTILHSGSLRQIIYVSKTFSSDIICRITG